MTYFLFLTARYSPSLFQVHYALDWPLGMGP